MQNVRDVAGIPVRGGGVVRSGVLLRGDAPFAGDPPPLLKAWPPRTVLDLRSPSERTGPHPLAAPGTAIHLLPLSVELSGAEASTEDALRDGGLPELYRRVVEGIGPSTARAVEVVADAAFPVLLHCAHGKDRTGILVAIILDSVGAEREAIVADYEATAANMPRVIDRVDAACPAAGAQNRRLLAAYPQSADAPADAILGVLSTIDAVGGTADWLRHHGLAADRMMRLQRRLVSSR